MLSVLGPTVLIVLQLGQIGAILSNIDTDDPGRPCSVDGRSGVCMYSMVCTFAKGTHLGTCRYIVDLMMTFLRLLFSGTALYLGVAANCHSHKLRLWLMRILSGGTRLTIYH